MKDRVSNQEIKIRIYLVFDPFQVYIKNSKETVSRQDNEKYKKFNRDIYMQSGFLAKTK